MGSPILQCQDALVDGSKYVSLEAQTNAAPLQSLASKLSDSHRGQNPTEW